MLSSVVALVDHVPAATLYAKKPFLLLPCVAQIVVPSVASAAPALSFCGAFASLVHVPVVAFGTNLAKSLLPFALRAINRRADRRHRAARVRAPRESSAMGVHVFVATL